MIDLRPVTRRHEAEIRAFRRGLFADRSDTTEWIAADGDGEVPRLQRLGPVKSVTDRHAVLTVVSDLVDLAVLAQAPDATGTVLTLSIAAHHRILHSRLPVDEGEAAAWVREILGENWAGHVYAGGAGNATGGGGDGSVGVRVTTRYFQVFIDGTGRPRGPHPAVPGPLVRLSGG